MHPALQHAAQQGRESVLSEIGSLISLLEEELQETTISKGDVCGLLDDIKAMASEAALPLMVEVACRFRGFMQVWDKADSKARRDALVFADTLRDLLTDYSRGVAIAADELFDLLPVVGKPKKEMEVSLEEGKAIEILLVIPDRTSQRIFARELVNSGLCALKAHSSGEALMLAVHHKPSFILISAVLDEISGIDLALALRAMPVTQGLKLGILTSYDRNHDELQGLPVDIPIVNKSRFADDFADVLVSQKVIYC